MEKNNTMKYKSKAYREIKGYLTVYQSKVFKMRLTGHVVFLLRPGRNQGSSL